MAMKTGLIVAVLAVSSMLGAAHAAPPSPGNYLEPAHDSDLPSDVGEVSIESSRRSMQAYMQDWKDDEAEISTRREVACVLSATGFSFGSPYSLLLLGGLANTVALFPTDGGGSPASPLNAPLAQLEQNVFLTFGEMQALVKLKTREVQDRSDQIRLVIDTQWFLMRVSKRLFDDKIQYHRGRTEGFIGFFRSDTETCAALTLQTQRDRELVKAGERILQYYRFLEDQLQD